MRSDPMGLSGVYTALLDSQPPAQFAAAGRGAARLRLQRVSLANQEYALHFQSRCDARGGAVGAEALLRWRPPGQAAASPDRFIAAAERTGFIHELGGWVLRHACRVASAVESLGRRDFRISVNVSPVQFSAPAYLHAFAGMLRALDIPPRLIELEITEHGLFSNFDEALAFMHELRATGLAIAIDDFGAGFNSLQMLARIPATTVKIDAGFVRRIERSEVDRKIVRGIIDLAHDLGLTVVAEGVETPAQADLLRAWCCDEYQGFLFARPLDENAFLSSLIAHEPLCA